MTRMPIGAEIMVFCKSKIDGVLRELISEFLDMPLLRASFPQMVPAFTEFALRPGKRIRPLVFVSSYLAAKGSPDYGLYRSASALELLHLFALIHDDVVDGSDFRRGGESLHRIFEGVPGIGGAPEGKNLAVIIGDALYAFAISKFMEKAEEPENRRRALEALLEAAEQTGKGQMLELLFSSKSPHAVTRDEVFEIYDLKTSAYTFAGPLVAGALMAGAGDTVTPKLRKAGIMFGRAYQMMDDLCECMESLSNGRVPADLTGGRKTVITWYLFHCDDDSAQSVLHSGKGWVGITAEELSEIIERTKTFRYVSDQIENQLSYAFASLPDEEDGVSFQDGFGSFIESLFIPLLMIK